MEKDAKYARGSFVVCLLVTVILRAGASSLTCLADVHMFFFGYQPISGADSHGDAQNRSDAKGGPAQRIVPRPYGREVTLDAGNHSGRAASAVARG